ncbi:hypothetical protein ACSBR2_014999 [Camellia fascicularis]
MALPRVSFFLLLVIAITIIVTLVAPTSASNEPFRGTYHRVLAQSLRAPLATCNKYPRVCAAKGSPGPDCCGKHCVNVMTDKLNCGKCGKKCVYSEMCCQGECVNPSVDKKHCGRCNKKCNNGGSCVYGLCSYS